MALITANGVGVLDGSVFSFPLVGVWVADLVLDQPTGAGFEAGKKVSIQAVNGIQLNGIVDPDRTGSYLDAIHVRILGGAGGANKLVKPRGYAQPSALVRDVLNGLMTDSGETLSSTIGNDVLQANLIAWNTMALPMSFALSTLINHALPGANWRILQDGTVWIGKETFDTANPEFILLTNDPKEGTFDLGVDSPSIVPGVTIDGIGKVVKAEHTLEKEGVRTRVWIELQEQDRGIRASIGEIVRQELNGIDYFTLYDAKVISQSTDLSTVDLQPGDHRLPGLQRVPLRIGLPGTKVQFSSGAVVRLGWDRGNPSMPYASLWNGGATVQSIQLGGNTPVARKDDNLSASAAFKTWAAAVDSGISSNTPPPTPFATAAGLPGGMGIIHKGSDIVGAG